MKTKKNLAVIALSSVVCLLPVILSFAVYDDLPEEVAIHWDIAGNPNNFAPRAAAAFGLPLLFLAINIISKIFLYNDPKRDNISGAMRTIVEWLIPFLSLALVPIMLFIAIGVKIPIGIIVMALVGIIFILCGNYLPKSRQNYVVGIRLPWTLNDTDNWNKTHRMAGYLWIFGGIALIIGSFVLFEIPSFLPVVILSIITLLIIAPVVYSYALYKRSEHSQGA